MYIVFENDGSNSSRIRCLFCFECLLGEELLLLCGIILVIRVVGECILCSLGMYLDEIDSVVCKVCIDCGFRKIVNFCIV